MPVMVLDPAVLDFGGTQTQLPFSVGNGGLGTLDYQFSGAPAWVSAINPSSGTSLNPSNRQTHTVTIDRAKLTLGTNTAALTITSAQAANSPQTIQLRAVCAPTMLTGKVVAGGLPVAGAQVLIDPLQVAVLTATNGYFSITNIPVGCGYVAIVSAAGYATVRTNGITIVPGVNDLGFISLTPVLGPYRIIPLTPEVNPPSSILEEGGVAYRYYLVVGADGKTPVVSSNITLRISGGSRIPQDNDVSAVWAGRVAGIPDGDGIVRLRIAATNLGPVNTDNTLEVLESGVLQTTFTARVMPRTTDYVWRHKVGVGTGGKLGVTAPLALNGSARRSYETEVRQTLRSGQVTDERIRRTRDFEARAGVSVESPGVKLLGGGFSADAGAGVLGGVELSSEYKFEPATTDAYDNALKVYLALGDDLSYAANLLGLAVYDYLRGALEPYFLGDKLISAGGDARLGVYGEASAQLGWKLGRTAGVGFRRGLFGGLLRAGWYRADLPAFLGDRLVAWLWWQRIGFTAGWGILQRQIPKGRL